MISLEDIRSLAQLARLKLMGDEETNLQKDISGILDYVGQVRAVSVSAAQETPAHRNVMREDVPGEVLGKRDALTAAFPKREGDFNVVRKIIEKDVE
ncbi:MAG: Asp-tRNA(Asn)/Glu-tRNA(Gln) amidotransferase subunit GatC [Patescibacteria group bacterium]